MNEERGRKKNITHITELQRATKLTSDLSVCPWVTLKKQTEGTPKQRQLESAARTVLKQWGWGSLVEPLPSTLEGGEGRKVGRRVNPEHSKFLSVANSLDA